MRFGDLSAKRQADASPALLGRKERHEQVRCVGDARTFIINDNLMTMPVGLERFFTEYASNWPGLMAASFIMSVPVVVLFLVLQRHFVRALTEGAVKH